MSLWKRGNKYWSIFELDGVRYQQSTGTNNRRLAEQIETKFKTEANAKRYQLVEYDPNITVGEIIVRFVTDAPAKAHHLFQFKTLLPFFGDTPVARLNRNMAHEYRLWRKRNKAVCDATVNRALACLRRVLFWALDESLIQSNPFSRVPMVPERRRKRPIMNVAEEDRLLPLLSPHLKGIVIAALDTGMRRAAPARPWLPFFPNLYGTGMLPTGSHDH